MLKRCVKVVVKCRHLIKSGKVKIKLVRNVIFAANCQKAGSVGKYIT